MSAKLETLSQRLHDEFGDKLKSLKTALGEVTVEVAAADYLSVMHVLHDKSELGFEELTDLCGVDYSTYGDSEWSGRRYAAVTHCCPLVTTGACGFVSLLKITNFLLLIQLLVSGIVQIGLSAKLLTFWYCFCGS